MTEDRRQMTDDGIRKAEFGSRKKGTVNQMPDDGGQVTEVRGQMVEMPLAGKNTNEHRIIYRLLERF